MTPKEGRNIGAFVVWTVLIIAGFTLTFTLICVAIQALGYELPWKPAQ
jgi:hypothetical protein